MEKPGIQAFTILSMFAAFVHGRDMCSNFSCGHLKDVRYPFRRPGDPPECGVGLYELVCSSSEATIYINTGTYFVTEVNFSASYFRAVDANLDANSSCPLPRWNQFPYTSSRVDESEGIIFLEIEGQWACFINCSRAIMDNIFYDPIPCLSSNNSHVYIFNGPCKAGYLEHSCGYLAMIPYGGYRYDFPHQRDQFELNGSYTDTVQLISKGFFVNFPQRYHAGRSYNVIIKACLKNSISYFNEQISGASILNHSRAFFGAGIHFSDCLYDRSYPRPGPPFVVAHSIIYGLSILSLLNMLCRFLLAPLAVLIFLAHKHWKTRITIDAVEKFLRMQQMVGPTRYAYTDITAITSHFRDKLGQGGYGSVFKGVLLPGGLHVAVKMLAGNSNCNGEDFISEVSTIGRIHHVNVVRLVGFCSEEMRRALVYEYMPGGSLDKYIFSADKSFSWDKLNEIALGIARGINYLHKGCDMQILHFDIKPHNILLDSNFIPKVADFGLAKLYPKDNNFVPLSALRGTIGYIAPEMISRGFGVVSSKSDVYSFGMLLLEMAGGRRNADPNAGSSSHAYYPSWVYDRLTDQEVDENEIYVSDDMHELEKKLCVVGLWCIQMKSQDRPTMSEVIEMLEGEAGVLQMPSRPFFCDDGPNHIEDSYHLASELTAISEEDD